MGTNYYQEYSEDDPPDLNDISPEDIDVADISEDLINFGKSALNFSENFYWEKIVKKYLKLIN